MSTVLSYQIERNVERSTIKTGNGDRKKWKI
jgi:hypothetical protein